MKQFIKGIAVGITMMALVFGISRAYASSGIISDYQGVRGYDGQTGQIIEKENHLFIVNDMDGSESLVTAFDPADGSQYDIVLK